MNEDETRRRALGSRLASARKAKGLTQQQVADLFQISKGTVSAWEKGGGVPDALRLARLANQYEVSADALLRDDHLSAEAMRVAAQYDSLSSAQRRMFNAMWTAFVEQASTAGPHIDGTPQPRDNPNDE